MNQLNGNILNKEHWQEAQNARSVLKNLRNNKEIHFLRI